MVRERVFSDGGTMKQKEKAPGSGQRDPCCKKLEVPSEEELTALRAMKAIKVRVRSLKKRLSELSISSREQDRQEALRIEKEMAELRSAWEGWEEKRKEAARERMILLGHE